MARTEEQMHPEGQVELRSVAIIKPRSPTAPQQQRQTLPGLDKLWIPVRNLRRLLFYSIPAHQTFAEVVQSLKLSLSSVLVDFYPVAGRLALHPDQNLQTQEIDCNDAGVEFRVAFLQFPFAALQHNRFAHQDWYKLLAPSFTDLSTSSSHPDVPLLSVQVTEFSGGGMCIGTAFHHVLGDGNSYWHFMNSWSQICGGLAAITQKPHHMRNFFLLSTRNNNSSRKIQAKWVNLNLNLNLNQNQGRAAELQDYAQVLKFVESDEATEDDDNNNTNFLERYYWEGEKTQTKTFLVRRDGIEWLKRESGAHSTTVAILAKVWPSMMQARRVDASAATCLLFLVDGRARLRPTIPASYFGNCVFVGMVRVRVQTLVDANAASVAALIQAAIDGMTKDEEAQQLWNEAAWMEQGEESPAERMLAKWAEGGVGMNVSGSVRFPAYDADFGWGRPHAVDVAGLNEVGSLYLASARASVSDSASASTGGGVELTTSLPSSQMAHLERSLGPCFQFLLAPLT